MNVRESPGKSRGVTVYNGTGMAGAAGAASLPLSPLQRLSLSLRGQTLWARS